MSRHENDEFATPADKSCCMCHNGQGTGTWELCRPCRDGLKEKAAHHEATANSPTCINCGEPRRVRPAGLYCERCLTRFAARR